MNKLKKYIALCLSVLIIISVFTVLPSASAYGNSTVNISSKNDNNANLNDDNSLPNEEINKYIVSFKLRNVVSDNEETEISEGSSYQAILIPMSGYKMDNVLVKMGDEKIKSYLTENSCIIEIGKVTANITITAVAVSKEVTSPNTDADPSAEETTTSSTTEDKTSATSSTTGTTVTSSTTITTTSTTASTPSTTTSSTTATTTSTTTVKPTTSSTTVTATTDTIPTVTTTPKPTEPEPTKPVQIPYGKIKSTNNCANSQSVTLSLSNAKYYYFGTNKNTDTFEKVKANNIVKKVSKSGTYYLVVKNGDVVRDCSITFYKTTLNTNGGKANPKYIITEKNKSVTLPKPSKNKYGFNGWYLGNNKKTFYNNVKVNSDKTYNALWVSPKVTVKIRNKITVLDGYRKTISYNKDGIVSDWYKYSVNCKENVVWKPSDAKAKKVVTIKNDTKKGIVSFYINKKAKHKAYYGVDCIVAGKKVFSMKLYYFHFDKLSNVKISRNNKNTVSVTWNKIGYANGYVVTIVDKNTRKTIYKEISKNKNSYKYTKLNSKHKYSVSVRFSYEFKKSIYYGDAKAKII